MSDMDPLYESMKGSAEDMSKAAVEMRTMMTADQNTDVNIKGYGAKPSFSKQIVEAARNTDGGFLLRESNVSLGGALQSWVGLYGFTKGDSVGEDGVTTTANPNYAATDFIPVEKGDCFLIHTPSFSQPNIRLAALYDSNKTFIGFMGKSGVHDIQSATGAYTDRIDFKTSQLFIHPLRIPQKGYVRFQQTWNIYADTATCFGMFSIRKVAWDTFKDFIFLSDNAPDIDELAPYLFSPVADKESIRVAAVAQTIGAPLAFAVDANLYLTQRVAVTAGQFIHFIGASWGNYEQLIFTDAAGNFLGKARINDDVGNAIYTTGHTQHAGFNLKSPFTGFVAAQVSVQASFVSLAVTNERIKIGFKYAEDRMQIGRLTSANWYGDTSPETRGVYLAGQEWINAVQHFRTIPSSALRAQSNNKSIALKAITLRRGEVLVFKIPKGQSPFLGFANPVHSMSVTQGATAERPTAYLISPSTIPMVELQNLLNNTLYRRQSWWDPSLPAEAHYCNEDADSRVYLHAVEGQEYEVRVFATRDAYREYRDKVVLPSLTFAPGTINAATWILRNNQVCTNPFIVFEDEYASVPKIGTWWEGPALGTNAFDPGKSLFSYGSMQRVIPGFADKAAYDKPKNTVGFIQHTGFYTKSGRVAASAKPFAEVDSSYVNSANVTVNVTKYELPNTDASNVLRAYPPRVFRRSALLANELPGTRMNYYITHIGGGEGAPLRISPGVSLDTTCVIVPVFKGKQYKFSHSIWWNKSAYAYFFDTDTGLLTHVDSVDSSGAPADEFTYQGVEHYFTAPANGYFVFNAIDGSAASGESNVAKGNNNYQVGYTDLPSYEFDRLAKVIPGNIAEFPLEPGLKLNLINTILAMDSTKVRRTSGMAQVILGEKILGVVGFEMNVSGLGTAWDPKKGWNLKLKGGDGKKAIVKFGGFTASNKWGLKSYYLEGTHTRDTGGAQLWRDLRLQEGTKFIGPTSVISKAVARGRSVGNDWFTAPFSTQGFPIELYVGGKFFGMYTLRTRGEPEDYLMDASDGNNIMMGPDYGNHSAYASWANYDQTYWTIKSPSMKGYEDGDAVIPDATVAANIQRFSKWIADVMAGTVSLADTASEYLDTRSWVDYFLFSELTGNSDGIRNNVVVATWDGNVWALLPYDLDRTAGYNNSVSILSPSASVISQDAFLNKVIAYLQPQITAKYKALRANGFLSLNNIYKYYADVANVLPQATVDLEDKLWVTQSFVSQNTAFIYNWYAQRLPWLDGRWK